MRAGIRSNQDGGRTIVVTLAVRVIETLFWRVWSVAVLVMIELGGWTTLPLTVMTTLELVPSV